MIRVFGARSFGSVSHIRRNCLTPRSFRWLSHFDRAGCRAIFHLVGARNDLVTGLSLECYSGMLRSFSLGR
jgi:hypothetical protein